MGKVSENPSVPQMINWISDRYNMNKTALARMFQTTQATIHYWQKTGKISYKNLMKLRRSYYYLHNTTDPHAGQRYCRCCRKWHPLAKFREGKAVCRACENKKTLQHYWTSRDLRLKKHSAKVLIKS